MPAHAPVYDLMLLLSTDVPEERRAEIVGAAEVAIARGGGSVAARQDWGVRQLTYEIGHRADAQYHLIQFVGPPALLEDLSHNLRITDGVSRFRIIKAPPGVRFEPAPAAGHA